MFDMKSYKNEINRLLKDTGWAVAIVETETDGLLDERWVIRSVKQKWGMELHLHFFVERPENGEHEVCCINASKQRLRERPSADGSIAFLQLDDDGFDRRLTQFFAEIESFREKFRMY